MSLALVIDDNKSTTEVMVQMLKLWDIVARPVLSPGAAMGILSKEIPNIVFLDINMPGVDGFEVLAFLRREPRLAKVPVIIATSDDQPQTAKRAIEGGATAVLIKPVMVDMLEEILQKTGII
jgi:CheY-like chemotaxis protein